MSAVAGFGVSWVAGAGGSARQLQSGVGQRAVLSLDVGRFVGFVVPLVALAALLGWAAVGAWRERQADSRSGRASALVQSMEFVQPLLLPALAGGAVLIALDIGLPSSVRPAFSAPVAIASVTVAVVLGIGVAAFFTVRVRPAAMPATRVLTAIAVMAIAAGCLADGSGQRALGFSSVGLVSTGLSGEVAAVTCPAPRRCMAIGVADPSYSGRLPQRIVFAVTADGGRTWHIRSEPSDLGDVILPTLTCPSLENCYVAGSLFLAGDVKDSVVVDATHDGGRFWSSVPIPAFAPVGPRIPDVACLAPARCVMANGEEIALTTDAGRSWRVVRVVALGAQPTTRTLISCSGSRRCLVMSAVSQSLEDPLRGDNWFDLFSTTDGGSRWKESHISVGKGGQVALSGLGCGRTGECIASWSSTMNFVSTVTVEGSRWSTAPAPAGEPGLSGPVCFGQSCVASGTSTSRSGLFDSSDGGRRWSFRAGGPVGPFACWSTEECVAGRSVNRPAGSLAALTWTSDGGRSWHGVPFPVAPEVARPVSPLGGL